MTETSMAPSTTGSILDSLERIQAEPQKAAKPVKAKKISKKNKGNTPQDYINFLRALASPERLGILEALESHEMCTSDIEQKFYMEQSTASHHLNTLLKAKIVDCHKEGRRVFYRVNDDYLMTNYKRFYRALEGVPRLKGRLNYRTK